MKFQQLSIYALSAFVIVGSAAPVADANGAAVEERGVKWGSVSDAAHADNFISRDEIPALEKRPWKWNSAEPATPGERRDLNERGKWPRGKWPRAEVDLEARSDNVEDLEARGTCKRCKRGVDDAILEERTQPYKRDDSTLEERTQPYKREETIEERGQPYKRDDSTLEERTQPYKREAYKRAEGELLDERSFASKRDGEIEARATKTVAPIDIYKRDGEIEARATKSVAPIDIYKRADTAAIA